MSKHYPVTVYEANSRDILRFYREAPALLDSTDDVLTLGDYLQQHYSQTFIDDQILPMACALWSGPPHFAAKSTANGPLRDAQSAFALSFFDLVGDPFYLLAGFPFMAERHPFLWSS